MPPEPPNEADKMGVEKDLSKESSVKEEHESKILPFTQSPFREGSTSCANHESLLPIPDQVPWTSILLELAMTTALQNLAENTPILSGEAMTSFIAFFVLVWWIWASQVAYNMHFHKNDWIHRFVAFLNLLIFGTLSAFTKDFEIAAGLAPASDINASSSDVGLTLNFTVPGVSSVQNYRAERLPILGARGISLVLALSRLVLLLQYFVVFLYSHQKLPSLRRGLYRHMGVLSVSTACYLVAFGIMQRTDPDTQSKGANIARIVLWYFPIALELSIHFINSDFAQHTLYSSAIIYERASGFFTIILGTGLDNVTGGLKYLVGTLSFGARNVGWDLCGAIIIVGEFALYFEGNHQPFHYGNRRLLTWFFLHSLFLICLMITILSCALLLQYVSLMRAMADIVTLFSNVVSGTNSSNLQLDPSQYPRAQDAFRKLGLPFQGFLNDVNEALRDRSAGPAFLLLFQDVLQVIVVTFQEFDAYPEGDDPLAIRVQNFLTQQNATSTDEKNLHAIVLSLSRSRSDATRWFFPVAGGSLIMIAILNLVKQWPYGKLRWARIISMFVLGVGYTLVALINIGLDESPVPDQAGNSVTDVPDLSVPVIWNFPNLEWIVPSFAGLLLVQIIFNLILKWIDARQTRETIHPWRHEKTTLPQTSSTRSPPSPPRLESSVSRNTQVSLPRSSGEDEHRQLTSRS
ncbi:hypothetical protein SISSUDRAFT_191315 [Sistotremastrum suecicum HHB10207 ss-3]|uniref:Uncharacterized protein n=1 Tax=Sistotremastrum suecicum HHB10207 ss-3 TaxID=1314776 RepID=A0A166AD60_9AGAM|nr:hypothetical protein SISSUDRAFT_191315 [Sistotremastrum suecicum HHB10207 ss-3]